MVDDRRLQTGSRMLMHEQHVAQKPKLVRTGKVFGHVLYASASKGETP
jgi:hypothetical protein